jgi:hypothetical protein
VILHQRQANPPHQNEYLPVRSKPVMSGKLFILQTMSNFLVPLNAGATHETQLRITPSRLRKIGMARLLGRALGQ